VMPAVFGTAELSSTLQWISRMKARFPIVPTKRVLIGFFVTGWTMLFLLFAWPRTFFPFLWLSGYFILEPINIWLGNHSLADHTKEGNWRPVIALWIGCITTALFWEMWNYYSYPKWIYRIPYLDVFRIFEMPLLGYGGYLPFSLELFAIYNLIIGLFVKGRQFALVRIGND
jgi:hypothetical protein